MLLRNQIGTEGLPIANEGPDQAPSQVDSEDVAEPNVGSLQKDFAAVGYAELLLEEDAGTDGCQREDTNQIHMLRMLFPLRDERGDNFPDLPGARVVRR